MTLVYDQDIQSRKIFVGGLADATDDLSFVKYFKQYGDICDSIVMFDKITGKPKRFGFVVYVERSSLEKCLDACPHYVDGAEVNVKKASKPVPGGAATDDQGNTEIHVLFPFGSKMDKDMISMYFSQFGKVVSCTIPVNKVLNRPKNFCFVRFNERESVLRALDKKQHKMGEKSIFVTEFVQNKHKNQNRGHGPCGRKQELKPNFRPSGYSNRNSYRDSYYDDSYGDWNDNSSQFSGRGDYDRRGGFDGSGDAPRNFRGPPRPENDGYEYVLVKKEPSMSRNGDGPYRRGRDSPMSRGRDFDRYSPPHRGRMSPPPMMRGGGPMRNRDGPRDRFNPMARPQRNRQPGPPAKFRPLQDNKVFIGGLAKHTTNDTLMGYFSQFGGIFDHIVMSHASGISKGFGFVTFSERDSVDKCLNAGPHYIDGQDVNVKKAVLNPTKQ